MTPPFAAVGSFTFVSFFSGVLALTACDSGRPATSTATGGAAASTGGAVGTGGGAGTGGTTATGGASIVTGDAGSGAPRSDVVSTVVAPLLEVAGTGAPGTISIAADQRTPIPATAYGMNYWSWVDEWGNQVAGTEAAVHALKLGILRIGGHNNDTNDPQPFTHAELDAAIAYARAVGAEPLVQVPLLADEAGAKPTAQTAADMVTYLNKTQSYGVKYFSVGNEPDLYSSDDGMPEGYSATDYCTSFADFATAMKAVDSNIQVMGPDLSWKYLGSNDWVAPFLAGCGDSVDIIAVHRYPMDATQTTLPSVLDAADYFRDTLVDLRALIDDAGYPDTPLAVTEANVSWDGDPANAVLPGSPGTFLAGLYIADMFGIGLDEGLWTHAFWSISEGWTLGFINDQGDVRPSYHALRMYAEHFGPTVLKVTSAPTGFDVYASRNEADDTTALIVLNKNATSHTVTVELGGLPGSVAPVEHDFPGYSISAVEIPDSGTPRFFLYTQDDAAAGQGPKQVEG